jgi:hypothetical protein
MPHAFKTTPNHPAVAYLVRLHADIGGRIQATQAEAERLATEMMAVESVIKIFNPEYNVAAIAARRRQRTNPWFKRGTLFREALGVLRTATVPMTVREITDAVLAAKGITDADKRQRLGVEAGIRSSLEDHAGNAVCTLGDGTPKRWRLKD